MSNLTSKSNSGFLSAIRMKGFMLAVILVVVSIVGLATKGINFGIDFTGGYSSDFTTSLEVPTADMHKALTDFLPDDFSLSASSDNTHWTVKQAEDSSVVLNQQNLSSFSAQSGIDTMAMDSIFIGSQVGNELIEQGGLAMLAALLCIMAYLAVRFEWKLAVGSVAALFHDVVLVLGVFAWLGLSFDLTVLAGLLAVIGYSLNDSIVVGDRIRELMRIESGLKLGQIINSAVRETLGRTLVTSGTTLATVASIWLLAGKPLEGFAITLFVGIAVGTLSSITVAATVPELIKLDPDHYRIRAQEAALDSEP